MRLPGIDLDPAEERPPEPVLGKHPLDGLLQGIGGMLLHHLGEGGHLETPGYPVCL